MKVVGKMKLLKSVKNVSESASGHATQRRRVCDGVVRWKNEKQMQDTVVYPPDAE